MEKLYILVNKDLKIGKGKFAGQSSHACWTYALKSTLVDRNIIDVLYKNKDLIEYIYLEQETLEQIEQTNSYIVIRDKGLTQLQPNSLTCVVLGFMSEDKKDKIINEFKSGIFNKNTETIKDFIKGSECNLAMYIIVNNDITFSKEELAKIVSSTMFNLANKHNYSEEKIKNYMFAQKKIVLKCDSESLSKINTENSTVIKLEEEVACINIGIHDKSEVDDFVKSLKLYSK